MGDDESERNRAEEKKEEVLGPFPKAKKIRTGKALDFFGVPRLGSEMKAFQRFISLKLSGAGLGTLNSPVSRIIHFIFCPCQPSRKSCTFFRRLPTSQFNNLK